MKLIAISVSFVALIRGIVAPQYDPEIFRDLQGLGDEVAGAFTQRPNPSSASSSSASVPQWHRNQPYSQQWSDYQLAQHANHFAPYDPANAPGQLAHSDAYATAHWQNHEDLYNYPTYMQQSDVSRQHRYPDQHHLYPQPEQPHLFIPVQPEESHVPVQPASHGDQGVVADADLVRQTIDAGRLTILNYVYKRAERQQPLRNWLIAHLVRSNWVPEQSKEIILTEWGTQNFHELMSYLFLRRQAVQVVAVEGRVFHITHHALGSERNAEATWDTLPRTFMAFWTPEGNSFVAIGFYPMGRTQYYTLLKGTEAPSRALIKLYDPPGWNRRDFQEALEPQSSRESSQGEQLAPSSWTWGARQSRS